MSDDGSQPNVPKLQLFALKVVVILNFKAQKIRESN